MDPTIPKFNLKLVTTVDPLNERLIQRIEEATTAWILETRDASTRKGLIALGWLPPDPTTEEISDTQQAVFKRIATCPECCQKPRHWCPKCKELQHHASLLGQMWAERQP